MAKNKNVKITVKNIKGDFVNSYGQNGGTTAHTTNTLNNNQQKEANKWWNTTWFQIIALVGIIVGILGYLGISPSTISSKINLKPHPHLSLLDSQRKEKQLITIDSSRKINALPKYRKMLKKKEIIPEIKVDNTNGDVVTSINQSGGITAHTVNQYGKLERHINDDDRENLKNLDTSYKISVILYPNNPEANTYGLEIAKYLKTLGYHFVLNSVDATFGGRYAERLNITKNDEFKTIAIEIQGQK